MGPEAMDPIRQVYGGTQEAFLEQGEEAINKGLQMIRETIEVKGDLKELFFRVLEVFEKKRHQIAVEQGSSGASSFGRRRYEDSVGIFNYSCISVNERDLVYNQNYLTFLKDNLKGKIPQSGSVSTKEFTIQESCLGRTCSFECTLMTEAEVERLGWTEEFFDGTMVRDACSQAGLSTPPAISITAINDEHFPPTDEERPFIDKYKEHLTKVKKEDPNQYTKLKMQGAFRKAQECLPRSKEIFSKFKTASKLLFGDDALEFFYIIGKVRLQLHDKMYALSEYLSWGFQTGDDPVGSFDSSGVVLIHQDQFLINETLKDASSCFEKAFQWDNAGGDINDLMDRVCPLVYLDWHATRVARGSATIGEWIEQLPYRYLTGKKLIRLKKGDLEAMSAPLFSTFRKTYDSQITLS